MKLTRLIVLLFIASSLLFAQNEESKKLELKTFQDSVSYSAGSYIAKNLHDPSFPYNIDIVIQAIKDFNTDKRLLTDQQVQKCLMAFNEKMTAERTKQLDSVKNVNKTLGDNFLKENKTKEGVKVLADGLQYKVLKSGQGTSPKETDTVVVNYKGTLIDGSEFDSSFKRNQPAEFPVNRVIKGWIEALQLMKVGDKWELYVPEDLAYGEQGAGGMIKPYSTLIFEIELLQIKPDIKNNTAPKGKAKTNSKEKSKKK